MKTIYLVCTKDYSDDLPFFNCEPLFACSTLKKAQNMKSVLPSPPDGFERDIIELKLY